jgi:thiol-disulfide isomerase/thioredoxin
MSLPVRCVLVASLLLVCGSLLSRGDQPPAGEVKLDVVKWKAFQEALKSNRGKIVVVDLWGWFCLPCKKEFPHLVELHRKYRDKGVAAVSLSLDQIEDKAKTLKFLQGQSATFANYLLDEEPKVWQDHYDINGPPAVFVYDRTGKLAGRFDYNDPDKQFTYPDVEKLVRKLVSDTK